MADICIATTYRMGVNHGTMLNIKCLKIFRMLFILVPRMVLPPPFRSDLPSEVHASPSLEGPIRAPRPVGLRRVVSQRPTHQIKSDNRPPAILARGLEGSSPWLNKTTHYSTRHASSKKGKIASVMLG
jgi:hypothetical protein